MKRAAVFCGPALVLLAALVVYPIGYTIVRSLFGGDGESFVGLANYQEIFTSPETLTALRNNAVWVVLAPSLVTIAGLFFAVLTDRIRWASAVKVVIFLPMAISFLAAGVTWRMVYEADPDRGIANAAIVTVHDAFADRPPYPGARLRSTEDTAGRFAVVGVPAPADGVQATEGGSGVVWLDFAPGGGGRPGVIDPGEKGLPGVRVEAVRDGKVVAETTTGPDGRYTLPAGDHTIRLPDSNFAQPFNGVDWLGPSVVTPAIIGAYVWIWAGFAMVLISAGLAGIPRETLEAARIDGASEWQVLRRVTIPQLRPVLVVVWVTMVINVLKVFDLVLVLAPEAVQADANVVALQMWRVSFGGARDLGLGSALGVLLFLLVLPAMLFNLRRLRREG
ncbi:ABC transporter permease subunit [Longispora albida]|uniref:ABC transporter permease n=1 Tax=Longispora albida TaxID=203523 RepID=UPI0003738A8A|nr:ABC transporter permease subunit [Longispora albida]